MVIQQTVLRGVTQYYIMVLWLYPRQYEKEYPNTISWYCGYTTDSMKRSIPILYGIAVIPKIVSRGVTK